MSHVGGLVARIRDAGYRLARRVPLGSAAPGR